MRIQKSATRARGLKPRNTDSARSRNKVGTSKLTRAKTSQPKPRPDPQETPLTKQDMLVALLRRANGATIIELADATGWQTHSVRGAISAALKKKLNLSVESEPVEGRGRVYRIV